MSRFLFAANLRIFVPGAVAFAYWAAALFSFAGRGDSPSSNLKKK
jgi:hypothetical protein